MWKKGRKAGRQKGRKGGREELWALESMEVCGGVCSGCTHAGADLMPSKPEVDGMPSPARKGGIGDPRAKVLGVWRTGPQSWHC